MPQSPNHPQFWHALPRRHGDMTRADGGQRRQRHDHDGHPRRHAHRRARPRLPGRPAARRAATPPRQASVAGTSSSACTPSSRWSAAACSSTSPAPAAPTGSRPATRSPSTTSRRTARGQGTDGRRGRRRAGPQRLGPALRRGPRRTSAPETGVPGVSEAGARWLAEREVHAVGADTIAFERLAPRGGHALLPAHRVLLVEHGIYIVEAIDLEELAARRRARVHLRAVAAQPLRRHRLPGAAARGDVGMSATRPSPSSSATSPPARHVDGAARRRRRQRRHAGARHARDRRRRQHRCTTSAAAVWALRDRRRTRRPPPSACPTGCRPRMAAFVNGVLAHSLDYDDTHLPSVLHPSASVVPAALAAAEHAGADGARAGPRRRRRARGLRTPRHGGLRRGSRQLGLLRARPARHLDLRRHGRRGGGGPAARRRRRKRVTDVLGRRRVDGRRRHRGQPHRRHGQADALRLGRARRRRRRRARARTASPGRRPCSRAGSASSRRGCTPTATPTRSPTGSASAGRCPGIFFKPYPANHFTHAVDRRRPRALREQGVGPMTSTPGDSASRLADLRTIGEPIEVKRAPETGYKAQFSGPYAVTVGLLGGGGLGRVARRLHRRTGPGPRAPRADGEGRRRTPTSAAPRSSRTSSRPCVTAQLHDGREVWSRRCSPTAAARSGRCRSTRSRHQVPRQRRAGLRRADADAWRRPAVTCPRSRPSRPDAAARRASPGTCLRPDSPAPKEGSADAETTNST